MILALDLMPRPIHQSLCLGSPSCHSIYIIACVMCHMAGFWKDGVRGILPCVVNLSMVKGGKEESSVSTDPRNEVPKEKLWSLLGQRGDLWPCGRNTERFGCLWTIGPMGSETKDIPHLICPKEGSRRPSSLRACMVMFDQKGREYSHAICLNFHASKDDMDYEALLAGLVAFAERGMKDLHVLVDSRFLVDQVKGNRVPRTKGVKRYREEIMDVTALFYRF
nr:hypothetical protein [Tanacetum cinerariifolium]